MATQQSEHSRWTDLFSRSSLGPGIYFVKGSVRVFDHLFGGVELEECAGWERVYRTCLQLEVPNSDHCCISPINGVFDGRRNFAFLDGGFVSREGDYVGGLKGAWVIGRQALRLLCYELGVAQPRRWPGETRIPTHEELIAATFQQVEEQVEDLESRLDRFDSDEFSVYVPVCIDESPCVQRKG